VASWTGKSPDTPDSLRTCYGHPRENVTRGCYAENGPVEFKLNRVERLDEWTGKGITQRTHLTVTLQSTLSLVLEACRPTDGRTLIGSRYKVVVVVVVGGGGGGGVFVEDCNKQMLTLTRTIRTTARYMRGASFQARRLFAGGRVYLRRKVCTCSHLALVFELNKCVGPRTARPKRRLAALRPGHLHHHRVACL